MTEQTHSKATVRASLKRKVSAAFVPDSMLSYLVGSLETSFDHLKDHILEDCAFVKAKVGSGATYLKQLLEELFRYLYLLADNSSDGVVRSSPSYFVDQAFHCLMLDPVLYFQVCDAVLTLQGRGEVRVRVLPHDALGGKGRDEIPRKARYFDTLTRYKQTFGQDPPLALWTDYSNDNIAVMAEFEAQQAQFAATTRPHHAHSRNEASVATGVPPTAPPVLSAPAAPRMSASKILAASVVATKAATNVAVAPAAVAQKTPDMKDRIKLRVEDKYGDFFDTTMALGDKFKGLIGTVAHCQGRKPKDVELRYKTLLLAGDMQPFSLNLRDGDVVVCSGSAAGPATHVNFFIAGCGSELITAVSRRLTLREMCDRFIERASHHQATLGWTFTYKGQEITDFTQTLLDIGHENHGSIVCTKILPPEPVAPVVQPVLPVVSAGAGADDGRVTLKIIDQNGLETAVRLKRSAPFKSLFAAYAAEKKVSVQGLQFMRLGTKLEDSVSPQSVGLKDNDEIHVVLM